MQPFRLTVDYNRSRLNIGQPTSLGVLLGVAYLIAGVGGLPA